MKINKKFFLPVRETVFISLMLMMAVPSMMAMFIKQPSPKRQKKIAEMMAKRETVWLRDLVAGKRPKRENLAATKEWQARGFVEKIKEEIQGLDEESLKASLKASEEKLDQKLQLGGVRQEAQQVKWIQAIDGVQSIPLWQANQMDVLAAQGTQENPIDVTKSKIGSFDLQLLSDAYNALAHGVFNQFCAALAVEEEGVKWDESGKIYSFGKGRLRKLVDAAGKLGAKTLSTLLAALLLPTEMHNKVAPEEFIRYVCAYLQEQLLRSRPIKKAGKAISFAESSTCFSLNSDDSQCLIGGSKGELALVDRMTGDSIKFVGYPADAIVESCALNKAGNRAFSVTKFGLHDCFLWDVSTGKLLKTLQDRRVLSDAISFSPDGKRILAGVGNVIKMWNSSDGELLGQFDPDAPGGIGDISAISWHPDGRYFVAISFRDPKSYRCSLVVGDTETFKCTTQIIGFPIAQTMDAALKMHSGKIFFSPKTGKMIFGVIGDELRGYKFLIDESDDSKFMCKHINSTPINYFYSSSLVSFSNDEQFIAIKLNSAEGEEGEERLEDEYFQIYGSKSYDNKLPMLYSSDMKAISSTFSPDGNWFVMLKGTMTGSKQLSFYNNYTHHVMNVDVGRFWISWYTSDNFSFDHTGKTLFVNNGKGLDVYQLFTDKDMKTLEDIKTNLTGAQALLLYQLCLAKQKGAVVEVDEGFKKEVVKTLHDLSYNVQQMVSKYLIPLKLRSAIASTVSSAVSGASRAAYRWLWGLGEK